jgi:hypothetical protein
MTILVPGGHGERATLFGVMRDRQMGNQVFQDARAAFAAAAMLRQEEAPGADIDVVQIEVRILRVVTDGSSPVVVRG